MTHTPGPWKFVVRGKSDVPIVFRKGAGIRMPIAIVKEVYMSKAERLANARLIAEAPALLEAAKDAHESIDHLLNGDHELYIVALPEHLEEQLRAQLKWLEAAIKSAEGEE